MFSDSFALFIFTFELVVKVVGAQYNPLTYLSSNWNKIDAAIVLEGWLAFLGLTPGLSYLRIIRL